MATRAIIAIKTETEIKAIYCHYDGYLQGVGKFLLQHFSTDVFDYMQKSNNVQLEKFITNGSTRSIHPLDLQNTQKNEVYLYKNIEELKNEAKKNFGAEFIYLLDSNKWNYCQISDFTHYSKFVDFKELTEKICN